METKLLNTFAIIKAAESVTGKPVKEIRGSTRVASVVAVRNLCYKVAKEQLNLADRDIAASFGRDRSAVTHSLKQVEKHLAQRANYRVLLSLIEEELGL